MSEMNENKCALIDFDTTASNSLSLSTVTIADNKLSVYTISSEHGELQLLVDDSKNVHGGSVCDANRKVTYYISSTDCLTHVETFAKSYGVDFHELEVNADFVEKANAILAGKDYDSRIIISVEMTQDLIDFVQSAGVEDVQAFMQETIDNLTKEMSGLTDDQLKQKISNLMGLSDGTFRWEQTPSL